MENQINFNNNFILNYNNKTDFNQKNIDIKSEEKKINSKENSNQEFDTKNKNIIKEIIDIIFDQKGIKFQIDQDTNKVFSIVYDKDTNKEIRKIPSDLFLKIAKKLLDKNSFLINEIV